MLIAHPMETGFRAGPDGKRLPRDILRRFTCRYLGEVVVAVDLYPADRGESLPRVRGARGRDRSADLHLGRRRRLRADRDRDARRRRMSASRAVAALLALAAACAARARSPTRAAPASTSWDRRRRRCSATIRRTRRCCGSAKARRCGRARPAARIAPAPTATATRRRRCAASRRAIPRSTRRSTGRSRSASASGCAARATSRATAFAPESDPRLALEAFVALQSRGLPIAPPDDPRLAASRERGRALWQTRIGQLDLACAQCHDANAGRRLGGSTIPAGAPDRAIRSTGSSGRASGSLERRLRGCMTGVRAEPAAYGSSDLVDLQAWLAWRARGMLVESPGVRP